MRKLQDWTSNQLYRWRAALKKGQKPPSPALRQHLANGSEPPMAPAQSPAKTKPCPTKRRSGKVQPIEKPTDKSTKKKPIVCSPVSAERKETAVSTEQMSESSLAAELETLEPELGSAEMQQEAVCQALGRTTCTTASGQIDEEWIVQQEDSGVAARDRDAAVWAAASLRSFDSWDVANEIEAAPGPRTPVSEAIVLEEQQPVQDMEHLFHVEETWRVDEPDTRRDATSPVWESGVTTPDLFSPRASDPKKKRSLASLEDDMDKTRIGAKRQAVMITEPGSFEKSTGKTDAFLTRLSSWCALNPLRNSFSLSEPSGPLLLGRCESSRECFSPVANLERNVSAGGDAVDMALSNDLSEWGSTKLARQRSWGAPLPLPLPIDNIDDIDDISCC